MSKYKIIDYSLSKQYNYICLTDNISSMTDKLIRITAKITECYAGDIVRDINEILEAVKKGEDYDRILFFKECGVEHLDLSVRELDNFMKYNSKDFIQVWRISHNGNKTILKRVSVMGGKLK